MKKSLRDRRDRAAERHDSALARFPTRGGAEFTRELEAVVQEMNAVAEAADDSDADPVEVAKTYRWLGDAYFDLARGKDVGLLNRGAAAYRRATELLAEAEAPVERAKLDFNFANTIRGLSEGTDVGMLEAAQTRYESAVRAFRQHDLPDLASVVAEQLQTIDPQLRLARKMKDMQRGFGKLEDLRQELEAGASALDRDRIARELDELRKKPASGDVAGALDEALSAIGKQAAAHPDRFEEDPASKLEALRTQMDALKGLTQEAAARAQGAEADPEDAAMTNIAELLKQRIADDVSSGKVSGDRGAQLGAIFDEFTKTMQSGGDDVESRAKPTRKMRELIERVAGAANDPSWTTPAPAAGTPAERGVRVLDPLRRYLIGELIKQMQPSEESSTGTDLFARVAELETRLREAHDDDARAAKLEDEVWPLAAEVQRHARRYHLTVAGPDFPIVDHSAKPRSLFVSGGDVLGALSAELANRQGLQLFERPRRGEIANERWTQLRAARVAVFDLGVPAGSERAQVCYELGLALALGKPCVILRRPGQVLPFDVELQPVDVAGTEDSDVQVLDAAVHGALGSIDWGGGTAGLGNGTRQAMSWIERRFPHRFEDGNVRIARDLALRNLDDAVAFRGGFQQLLGMLGADAPAVLFPAWPPAYPDPEEKPRCFHVMPFGEKWSDDVRDAARKACGTAWRYTRGDESDEQRIIPGIWREISRASAVLIDVTGHNPNVALELGLVHALGRPYRVVAQGDVTESMFPSLGKVQIHSYGKAPRFAGIAKHVKGLLGATRPA